MRRFALMISLVAASAAMIPAAAMAQSPLASGDATMLKELPAGMRLSKDEVYSMYLAAIRSGSVEKSSGDSSMIIIMAGGKMAKSREQVLKELMDQTPAERQKANKP